MTLSRIITVRLGGFALLGAALIWLVYFPVLDNAFVQWDDHVFIQNNLSIRALGPDNLAWMLREIHLDHWHPLTWLSQAVTYAMSGLDARAFHVTNVWLHIGNSVWLFVLALVLIRLHRPAPLQNPAAWLAAGMAALLFALHPLNVEVVAWASARKDLLCAWFFWPTLIAYIFYTQAATRRARTYWYGLTLLLCALALLAKSMAVTLPALFLLLDFYPLRRPARWRLLWEKLPFFVLVLVPTGLTVWGQHSAGIMSGLALGMDARILNAANSLVLYLSKWLLPLQLSPFYPYPHALQSHWQTWTALLGCIAVTVLALYAWRKGARVWLALWLYYLITLAPVIGIVQVGSQAAADRYTYVTTLPLYLLAGFGAVWLAASGPLRVAVLAGVLLWPGGLGLLSWRQTAVWHDSLGLWQHVADTYPDNADAVHKLAVANQGLGQYQQAIAYYRYAARLAPGNGSLYFNQALAHRKLGEWDEALALYRLILDRQLLPPDHWPGVYCNMADVYLVIGDIAQARDALRAALALDPQQPYARKRLPELERDGG